MKSRHSILLLLVAAFLAATLSASFAAKPKPKTKTVLSTIGTTQLPGDWCKFGQAYTLGKGNALNVTIRRAEYVFGHVRVGKWNYWPKEGEKLLVIHYTLHNPLPKEQRVGYANITWTAVDAKSRNTNHLYLGVGVDDGSNQLLDQNLKQAQKIDVYALIRVTSEGEIPKLMAENRFDRGTPVARFDLRSDQNEHPKNTVKPLDPLYADPNDKTGATVLKKIPGTIGTLYMTGIWDSRIEKIEIVEPPLEKEGYKKGEVYVLATLEGTFFGEGQGAFGGSGSPTHGMKLEDVDGVTYQYSYGPITATSNRRFSPNAGPGETIKARFAFSVPKGIGLKTLTLKEYNGYPIVIDVSAYKTPE